jgi:hypothetical protein
MFIATDVSKERTPSGGRVPLIASLHFTPDGVSGRRHVITINIPLLTEGASTDSSLCRAIPLLVVKRLKSISFSLSTRIKELLPGTD